MPVHSLFGDFNVQNLMNCSDKEEELHRKQQVKREIRTEIFFVLCLVHSGCEVRRAFHTCFVI